MDKVIILAAGEGTRMKSNISKVLHKICNRSVLSYVVDASKAINPDETIVIVGKNEEAIKEEFGEKLKYIKQEIGEGIPYGTGYAVKLAENYMEGDFDILIMNGDGPLLREETLKKFIKYHKENENDATLLTAEFEDPTGYGRIAKDKDGNFLSIVEHKDCTKEQLEIKEIYSGTGIFNALKLKKYLDKLDTNNTQGELYLTDIYEIMRKEALKVSTYILEDNIEIMGLNNKVQLAEVEKEMRKRINEEYMLQGVIMENPESITIEKDVKIGMDTVIEQNVKILGNTEIGSNCHIGMNSQIVDATIKDEVKIYSSFIEKAIVENGADIGPFARLRPNAHIMDKVHIGNFVEVKNATVGKNTKAGHLIYIGDADIGERVNVSCGVIFANYDGKNKFRAKVGDDAFLGSNVNIVAPVEIANKAFLAAGSTITKNVEEGQLSIERAEQKNIDGYYNKKFNK